MGRQGYSALLSALVYRWHDCGLSDRLGYIGVLVVYSPKKLKIGAKKTPMPPTKPRKPTKQKEAQGTLQPCRTNADEPDPSSSPMVAPSYLSDAARANFDYLASEMEEIGIASSTFNAVVAEAAALMEIIENCNLYLQAYFAQHRRYSYETPNGGHKSLPEMGIKLAATGKLKGYLSLIGISPSDISRVHGKKKEPVAGKRLDFL